MAKESITNQLTRKARKMEGRNNFRPQFPSSRSCAVFPIPPGPLTLPGLSALLHACGSNQMGSQARFEHLSDVIATCARLAGSLQNRRYFCGFFFQAGTGLESRATGGARVTRAPRSPRACLPLPEKRKK